MDFLLNIFGLRAGGAQRIVDRSLTFGGLEGTAFVLTLLGLLAMVGLVYWMYHRSSESLPLARKVTLTSLRGVFLFLILGLLLRPILTITYEQAIRRTVLLLVDTSESMSQITDLRSDDKDLKRAGIALGKLDASKGFNQTINGSVGLRQTNRMQLVKEAWQSQKMDLLPRLGANFDIEAYRFDGDSSEITPAAWHSEKAPASEEPASFWARHPLLVPTALLVLALGTLGVGYLIQERWPKIAGLGGCGVAVLWGIVAVVLTSKPAQARETPPQTLDEIRASINRKWVADLKADGKVTAIGNAVRQVIRRKAGQPVAGVVLITDGASNDGLSPLDAARLAKEDKVPLYIYGVGVSAPKDIIVGRNIFAPQVVFIDDDLPVTVRVRATGLTGQSATLNVSLGDEEKKSDVHFTGEGEQLVTVVLSPKKAGEFLIKADIPPREDEVVKDNNSASQRVRVIDKKIKVLYVEQSPRWEFKYVYAILSRRSAWSLSACWSRAIPRWRRWKSRRIWPSSRSARRTCSTTTWSSWAMSIPRCSGPTRSRCCTTMSRASADRW